MAGKKPPKRVTKEETVQIRLTAEQKRVLTEKAKRRGLGLSPWLLSLGMSAPDRPAGSDQ